MRRGQLLIESGIAISILIVGLLGILGLLSRSLSLNNVVSSQYIASNLASEGIEVVKNLLDANTIKFNRWNEGFSSGSFEVEYSTINLPLDTYRDRFLSFDSSTNTYKYGTGQLTPYKRDIEIVNKGDEIQVNSIISWSIRGGSYSVNLEDHFFDWRP